LILLNEERIIKKMIKKYTNDTNYGPVKHLMNYRIQMDQWTIIESYASAFHAINNLTKDIHQIFYNFHQLRHFECYWNLEAILILTSKIKTKI
jgi:hypothetical protein